MVDNIHLEKCVEGMLNIYFPFTKPSFQLSIVPAYYKHKFFRGNDYMLTVPYVAPSHFYPIPFVI